MTTKLGRIAAKARQHPTLRFTSLAHLLTPAFLLETWQAMNKRGAAGIDGQSIAEYTTHLKANLTDLNQRLRRGSYRAPPVRRVEIPKANGKTRALGIPTIEDRLLQAAVARILSAIYEPNFLNVSFGYRLKSLGAPVGHQLRGCHGCLYSMRRERRHQLLCDCTIKTYAADADACALRSTHHSTSAQVSMSVAGL